MSEKSYQLIETSGYSVLYSEGDMRQLKCGNLEIINNIYSAVRDRNWGTVPFTIDDEKVQLLENGFLITYSKRYQQEEIHFLAEFSIQGHGNRIIFEMKGTALSNFMKNRIGFCILHTLNCAGKPLTVTHASGTESQLLFPLQVSPNQPAKNIASMKWDPSAETSAKLNFFGDIFEMEDQRNWTDASFKTYSTPLELPFPVLIKKGQNIEQKIELEIQATKKYLDEEQQPALNIRKLDKNTLRLPSIGTSRATNIKVKEEKEFADLKEINFSHYRVDVHPGRQDWQVELSDAIREALNLNLPLELVLHFTAEYNQEFQKLFDFFAKNKPEIKCFILFNEHHVSTGSFFSETKNRLNELFPGIPVGGGSNANFAELNRSFPDYSSFDFVVFPVCPQVHAFDDLSLIENIQAQSHVVSSAQNIGGKPVRVSPVTLKQRFNVVATGKEKDIAPGELPPQVDIRQTTVFVAMWTLGSIKALAEGGCSSVTFFETAGMRGIMHGIHNEQFPACFNSTKGEKYPVYFMLKEILKWDDAEIIPAESNNPLVFDVLWLKKNGYSKLFIANYSNVDISVNISELHMQKAQIQTMANNGDFNHVRKDFNSNNLSIKACSYVMIHFEG